MPDLSSAPSRVEPSHRAGAGQHHVLAVVVLVEHRLDVFAGGVGHGVHVGDEAQGRLVFIAGGGGDGAVHIAVLIHSGVLDAQLLHLFHQQAGQVELALAGGVGARVGVRGGVHLGVPQKAFVSAHKSSPFSRPVPETGRAAVQFEWSVF